jgi:hypothetical protein
MIDQQAVVVEHQVSLQRQHAAGVGVHLGREVYVDAVGQHEAAARFGHFGFRHYFYAGPRVIRWRDGRVRGHRGSQRRAREKKKAPVAPHRIASSVTW